MKRIIIIAVVASFIHCLYAQTPLQPSASFAVGFSPGGSALAVVEKSINAAKSEIRMACYEFSSRDVADALEAATRRGVRVRIVADWQASLEPSSRIRSLQETGIAVRLDRHYSIHHHKFLVIDEVTLETGSFNYTTAANTHNAENVLVLWNVPQIAEVYAREWERLWAESNTE
jgi:phosphatidylserine/phosphatidylglycerophosphate/cardiolipin synthase-like enzyme